MFGFAAACESLPSPETYTKHQLEPDSLIIRAERTSMATGMPEPAWNWLKRHDVNVSIVKSGK